MHPLFVVLSEPAVQVSLEVSPGGVKLLPKRNPLELRAQGFVEALHAPVRLGPLPRGAGMIAMLQGQLPFVFMAVRTAAVFRAAIGQAAA